MTADHDLPTITADALFVITCPTCLGQLSAIANLAGRSACCPLCAAVFIVPAPRLPVQERPSPESPAADHAPPLDATPANSGVTLREPVKKAGHGAAAVELRRLSDEERRLRRGRRNVVLLLVGAAVLVAIVFVLGVPAGR